MVNIFSTEDRKMCPTWSHWGEISATTYWACISRVNYSEHLKVFVLT